MLSTTTSLRLAPLVLVAAGVSCFQAGESATSATASSSTSAATTTAPSDSASASVTTSGDTPDDSTGANTTGSTSTSTSDTTASGTTTSSTTDAPPAPVCGDGIVEGGEHCDLGEANADEGLCTTACQLPRCGDGFLQAGEECDHGDKLNDDGAACLSDCAKATCGDHKIWLGVEECDDGDENQAGLYGGCTPMTCTLGPHCDDEIVQKPWEECDLGEDNGKEDGACGKMCKLAGKMVFVTSKTYTGAIGLGGASAADDACNTVAMEAGLANAGNFRAWISDAKSSPSAWAPHPEGPFVLLSATIIANSWDDLIDGSLNAKVNVLETGEIAGGQWTVVWTGTDASGHPLADNCVGWTSFSSNDKGVWGSLKATNSAWTNLGATQCWDSARLICIEQ